MMHCTNAQESFHGNTSRCLSSTLDRNTLPMLILKNEVDLFEPEEITKEQVIAFKKRPPSSLRHAWRVVLLSYCHQQQTKHKKAPTVTFMALIQGWGTCLLSWAAWIVYYHWRAAKSINFILKLHHYLTMKKSVFSWPTILMLSQSFILTRFVLYVGWRKFWCGP